MTILTSENFDREVLNSDKPVVVDFWATWCGPCMMLSPIMEELDGEMPDVKFCKLNVDDERDLAIEYGVQSIPDAAVREKRRDRGHEHRLCRQGKHPRAHRGGAMKVRLNEDKDVVAKIREGLKRTGGYCPCRLARTEENKCMCEEFKRQIADPNFEGYCHCMLYYKEK